MNYCPKCRKKLVVQDFCVECGADLSAYQQQENSGIDSFDFSSLEREAKNQLAEQERLKDFEIENGVLTKYKGNGGKVVVPKNVTIIGTKAFSYDWMIREKISEVVFEGSITEIGEGAFCGCYNMKHIDLPSSVRKIGKDAFSSTGLEDITLPARLESIGSGAFGRSKLTSITIPGNVFVVGNDSFRSGVFATCEKLRSVTIEHGVTEIQAYMFENCGVLESVTLPNSIKTIGNGAFTDCVSLRSIVIPYGVQKLEARTFSNCRSLQSVQMPGSITSIGTEAFADCRSLQSITIPQSVTFIDDNTFSNCVTLERIQYNAASVNMIGCGTRGFSISSFFGFSDNTSSNEVRYSGYKNSAFKNAGSERSGIRVTFGTGVVRVPDGLFHAENCKIASISFEGGSACERIGAYAFYDCAMITSLQIPSRVTEIGDYALYGCRSITNLNLPSGVRKIGESAFSVCKNLATITMPSYLTEIASHTFNSCSNLRSITIPRGVSKIGEYAFFGCDSITSLEVPESVNEIGENALKIRGRLTLKLPKALSWHFFKEEYEFCRDDWKMIEY